MKILVVDDEQDWKEVTAEYLRDEGGYTVFEAGGVEEATTFLEANKDKIDYFVTDGLDGGWREIVSLANERQTPVVVFTTNSEILKEIRSQNGEVLTTLDKSDWHENKEVLLEAISPQGGPKEKRIG